MKHSTIYTWTHGGSTSGPMVGPVGGRGSFGRVPPSVGSDDRLSGMDVRVYWAMSMGARWAGTVTIGQRRMAELARTSRSQVQRSLDVLIECGHVKVWDEKKGKRQKYLLTSPIFSRRQGKEDIVVEGPSGGKRLAAVANRKAAG